MPEDTYSIADLARMAEVTPRTIRYYVAQGLLPSPGAAGPATRYGEAHLARLRLIRRLQRDHLPLAEIRARLERMGDEEVRVMVDGLPAADAPPPADTLAFVQDLMARSGLRSQVMDPSPGLPRMESLAVHARFEPAVPESFPAPPATAPASPAAVPSIPAPPVPVTTPADRTTWERHQLAPDVELHVRRPLDRHTNKRVEQLIRIARELFDELP